MRQATRAMVSTTVEKSNSRVYCLTASRSKSSSRGSGCRAFSSKARVMTDSGVPQAKRSKRGSNSMAGSLEGDGDNTQTTYQFGLDWEIEPSREGGGHLSAAFPFPQDVRKQALAATVKFLAPAPGQRLGRDQPRQPGPGGRGRQVQR